MFGVRKPINTLMELCTFSASEAKPHSRSPVAEPVSAAFQSVNQCSPVPTSKSAHPLRANDEASLASLSDNDSSLRSTTIDADATSSDGESASFQSHVSDVEAADDDVVAPVYSVMLLLQLRAASLRRGGAAAVKYSTRRLSELPEMEEQQAPVTSAKCSSSPSAPAPKARWAPASAGRSEDEIVARAARSILNKLTVEKFDLLHDRLATCGVKTPEQMALLMREIFEKATEQHNFVAMYADLCVRLEADARLSSAVGQDGSFRRLLLGQCQAAFEKLFEPEAEEEDEERQNRRKCRKLGNVKLVGHLLLRGMLHSRLLVECADALIASRSSCPEALEALAALLTIAGPRFDKKEWREKARLDAVFERAQGLTQDKSVATRLRFLLRDMLDLRQSGWEPKAGAKGPMRLEEVKKQAQQEQPHDTGGGQAAPRLPVRRTLRERMAAEQQVAPRLGKFEASPMSTASTALPSPAGSLASFGSQSCMSTPKPAPTPNTRNGRGVSFSLPKPAEQPAAPAPVAPVPVAAPAPAPAAAAGPFSLKEFHRELSSTLRDLGADLHVVAAVRRIRAQKVPLAHHSSEFVDILTRAAEEKRGPARRSTFAFAAGLMAAEDSAFDRSKCLEGLGTFFQEVYEELCLEVPRLRQIVSAELLPALRSVASAEDLGKVVPKELRAVL